MDESRIRASEDVGTVEFKTAFKGYNIAEVDEYVASQRAELEDIRAENAELYKKIEKLNTQLKKLKAAEEARSQKLDSTKAEADRIIKEAKKQAAQELLRTNRQCSLMVADMTEKVDEQKRLYEATRIEAAKFRRALFTLYRDHVELINAMSEASGAFDEDSSAAITDEELADMEELIGALDPEEEYDAVDQSAFSSPDGQTLLVEAFSDTASITIPPAVKGKDKKKDKKSAKAKKKAEKSSEEVQPETSEEAGINSREDAIYGEASMYDEMGRENDSDEILTQDVSADENVYSEKEYAEEDPEEYTEEDTEDGEVFADGDVAAEENAEYGEYADVSEDGYPEEYAEAEDEDVYADFGGEYENGKLLSEDTVFVMTEEDLEEFTNPDGTEMEYDGPVSVDSVFKKSYGEKDEFDRLYEDEKADALAEDQPHKDSHRAEGKGTKKKNGYGFKVSEKKRPDPDDDSNEFYMESDAEFDPGAKDGVPTGTVGSFGVTSKAPSSERRWKVKKSKSLTDEFDVIKAEADED